MESIKENQEKSNRGAQKALLGWFALYRREILVSFIIMLVGGTSFVLGRLSAVVSSREPVKIIMPSQQMAAVGQASLDVVQTVENKPIATQKAYVAAKTGKAYYLPWCGAVNRIKEENKVWFASKEEAEKAGYRPAANCPGI